MRLCSIEDCDRPANQARGWCYTHYTRWYRHGDPLVNLSSIGQTTSQRFWSKVLPARADECWLWQGSLVKGYGSFRWNERTGLAHRYAYEELIAPVPADLELDHLCRVPACVNPWHLEPVTHVINTERMWTAKRAGVMS